MAAAEFPSRHKESVPLPPDLSSFLSAPFDDRPQRRRMYFLIGALGILAAAAAAVSMWYGSRLAERRSSQTVALAQVMMQATSAHLWFEEILAGDSTEDISHVWQLLELSDSCAAALLHGGECAAFGRVAPVEDAALHRELAATQATLGTFAEILRERYAEGVSAGPGSRLDQLTDSVFTVLQARMETAEAELRRAIAAELRAFRVVETTLITVIVLVVGLGLLLLWRLEHRRKSLTTSLHAAFAKNRALLSAMPDMMFRVDADGTFLEFVPGGNVEPHVSPGDFLGKKVAEVMPAELAKRMMQDVTRTIETGEVRNHEYTLPSGGDECDYEYRLIRCGRDEALAIVRDITERKRAETALHKHALEKDILLRVSQSVSSTLDLETVLQAISDGAAQLLDIETAAIYLLEGEELFLGATTPPLDPQMPDTLRWAQLSDHPHILEAVSTQLPVTLSDTRLAKLSLMEKDVVELRQLRSLIYLPFQHEENVVGVLILGTISQPHEFSDHEIDLCRTITNELVLGIQNARLHERLKKHAIELETQITERKQAEEALRIERDNLKSVLGAMEDGVYVVNQQYDIQYVNPVLVSDFGPYEGHKCYAYFHDRDDVCPWCKNADVLAKRTVRWEWYSPKTQRTYDLIDTPLENPDGSISKLEIFRDITERKQAEEELRRLNRALTVISECNQALVRAIDEQTLLDDVCRILVQVGGYVLAWVGFADDGPEKTVTPVAHAGCEEGYLEKLDLTWAGTEPGRGPFWREEAATRGYASSCALPLRIADRILGALNVYAAEADALNQQEVGLLSELADDLAFGIEALRGRQQRDRALESLRESEEEVRESRDILSQAILGNAIATFVIDDKHNVTHWNTACENLTGFSAGEVIGTKKQWPAFYPAERPTLADIVVDGAKQADIARYFGDECQELTTVRGAYEGEGFFPAVGDGGSWLHYTAAPLRNRRGSIVGALETIQDITERKQAEQTLLVSEQRFRDFAEMLPEAAFETDRTLELTFANRRAFELFGYSDEDLTRGLNGLEMFAPEDRDRVKANFSMRIGGENPGVIEYQGWRKDGSTFPMLFHASSIMKEGEVFGLRGIVIDITEHKRADEALRESEERFKTLVTNSEEIIYLIAKDGTFLLSEGKGLSKLGLKPGEMVGRSVFEAYKDHPDMLDKMRKTFAGETITSVVKVGGNFFRNWYTPQRDNRDEVIGLLGLSVNITEQKQAEEALERSEALLTATGRMARVGGWEIDAKTLKVNWTEETYRIHEVPLGHTPPLEEAINFFHPDDRSKLETAIQRALEYGEPYDLEIRFITAKGRHLWTHTVCKPVTLDGKTVKLTGTFQDVTERRQAEDEIRELSVNLERRVVERTAQLEEANKELEAFSYSVSHDLKAPLRAIDGYSSILEEDHAEHLDAEGHRVLNVIHDNTRQMSELIDDLLSFSRLGRQALQPVNIETVELVDGIVAEQRLQAADREFRFFVETLPPIRGDRTLIRQVFDNLVSNAVKFTKPREVAEIEIGCHAEAGEDVFYVKDNGVGFDMTYVDKLFGVFQRLHYRDEFPGTGVGLAIVQRVIKRHGGRVWAEGKVNEGATFYFTLPRDMEDE